MGPVKFSFREIHLVTSGAGDFEVGLQLQAQHAWLQSSPSFESEMDQNEKLQRYSSDLPSTATHMRRTCAASP